MQLAATLATWAMVALAADEFEVATIRPTGPKPNGRWIRMQSANRFEARNHAVRTLIAAAYDLNPKAISGGPEWVDSEHWDVQAKTPGEGRPDQRAQMAMLRALLTERFQLAFHREPRRMPVYTLTLARSGPKLVESKPPAETPSGPPPLVFSLSPTVVKLPARQATMADFASVLQRSPLERPVLDQTGLGGRYDFDLEFSPDERLWGGILKRPDEADKPDLFAAVREQLGLQLTPGTGLVDAIVIDRIERPSAN